MTNQQGVPEALRLADALEFRTTSWPDKVFAAAELRRLHALTEIQQQELISESHRVLAAWQHNGDSTMTNQQGAPEALRLADEYDEDGWVVATPQWCRAAVNELRRLAAMVDAQQRANHVQNPAEIEHVAGDVSKNGAEVNMAQQPAPSEQQPFGWTKQSEIDSSNDFGGSINLWRRKYDCDVPVYLAQQPAPSAAAAVNSQLHDIDAGIEVMAWLRESGAPHLIYSKMSACLFGDPDRAKATAPQADSQPAPEYVGNGMFKGETIEKAAEHWANWCDVRCMTGLSEFLRVVAARAPADSVTAPAGGAVAEVVMAIRPPKASPAWLPHKIIHASLQWLDSVPVGTKLYATPPAQAADSVLEDAVPGIDAAFEAVRRGLCKLPRYSFYIDTGGGVRKVGDRIGKWIEFDEAHALFDPISVDAARKQGANHD